MTLLTNESRTMQIGVPNPCLSWLGGISQSIPTFFISVKILEAIVTGSSYFCSLDILPPHWFMSQLAKAMKYTFCSPPWPFFWQKYVFVKGL